MIPVVVVVVVEVVVVIVIVVVVVVLCSLQLSGALSDTSDTTSSLEASVALAMVRLGCSSLVVDW